MKKLFTIPVDSFFYGMWRSSVPFSCCYSACSEGEWTLRQGIKHVVFERLLSEDGKINASVPAMF